ncbi:hypothetical protein K4F52_004410, partial [Lecanicillium sp. MT-2017a]
MAAASEHGGVTETDTQEPQPPQQQQPVTIPLHNDSSNASSSTSGSSTAHEPPPPPVPASDPQLAVDPAAADSSDPGTSQPPTPVDASPSRKSSSSSGDIFKLKASEALRLLSASVELLVRMTGDIPPTPPPRTPTNPQMSDMQTEKENIVRTHSQKNLARMRQQAAMQDAAAAAAAASLPVKRPAEEAQVGGKTKLQAYSAAMSAQLASQQGHHDHGYGQDGTAEDDDVDGVKLRGQAPVHQSPPSPYVIVGADSQPINLQHGAITRKFYSKNEPPISINQYLQRLHQFCPMSAAVYLATSLYIHRLAVEERAIPVTRRNAHRLVLAGLRVAMKALEDLSYPHTKFAKVGGVSETELARLEISFCFLTGFELVVGEEPLRKHWETLRDGKASQMLQGMEVPALRLDRKPRN